MEKLTEREKEVLALIIRGMNNAEIAETLSITKDTAKAHITSILYKMKIKNRVQAAVKVLKEGIPLS